MDIIFKAIPIIDKNMYPLTWQHALGIVLVLLAGYYVIQSLFRYPIVRWTYAGILVIFIANLVHHGKRRKAVVDIFKLALV